MNTKTKKICVTALFTALILVATAYMQVPIALGYVHLGDVFIVISAFFLPIELCAPAAMLGAGLADLIAGYANYIPITMLSKGLMALILRAFISGDKIVIWKIIVGTFLASIAMQAVYTIYEGFYYGWSLAVANIPTALIQPGISIVVGSIVIMAFAKIKYLMRARAELTARKKK